MPPRTETKAASLAHQLSPGDWAVLGLIAEQPRHGFAISQIMAPEGELGRIWRVRQALVYRTLDVLTEHRLARRAGSEPSTRGPSRTLVEATPAGREALVAWLEEPVHRVREARSVLLLKVALLRRAGVSPVALLQRQRATLEQLTAGLESRVAVAEAEERTVLIWRSEAMQAGVRAIDRLLVDEASLSSRTE